MSQSYEIKGECAPKFGGVKDAFAANFEWGVEIGASFAAAIDGEVVVDLWAGDRDASGHPWERDTIVNVYSTTKVMAALCTLILVDRGELDLDAPVASVWPEFGQAGKERVLVRHVLSHTSGVAGWEEPIRVEDLYDWKHSVGLLAAQAPWWEPGTASGYHALTHGHLLGEVVRRVDGRTIGTFFREEVADPLGADFHIGLPKEHESRVGSLLAPDGAEMTGQGTADPGSIAARVLGNPRMQGEGANDPAWRAAEIPAVNGHGNARSVARVAAALACGGTLGGVHLLGPETLDRAIEEQSYGTDLVLGVPIRFGLGWGLRSKEIPLGTGDRTFFWGGWGGSLVVVDLDARVALAYVMNRMSPTTLGDPRGFAPALALFGSLQA